MFRTANESPTDVLPARRALPPTLIAFRDRAIAEAAGPHYQTGDELATALRVPFGGRVLPAAGSVIADTDMSS